MELKHQNFVFTSLQNAYSKNVMVCNRMQKNVPLVRQNVMKILSLYLRKTENCSEEKEGMGEREKRED